MKNKKNIAIIDSTPLFRAGMRLALQNAGFTVIAEGGVVSDALAIAEKVRPDALLVELATNSMIDVALQLPQENPAIAFLFLVAHKAFREASVLLEAGWKGCVLKEVPNEELVAAVEVVSNGGTYVSPELTPMMALDEPKSTTTPSQDKSLTKRELLILSLVAKGETNKIIARKLGIENRSLKNCMTRIMKKLGVRSRLEAALYFEKHLAEA